MARRRSNRKPLAPTAVSVAYAAALLEMLAYARALVHARLLARLPDFVERAAPVKTDAMPPGRRVNRILDRISDGFFRKFNHDRVENLAAKFMARTSELQLGQFHDLVHRAIGVTLNQAVDRGIRATVANATARNVSLIKSIPQTYFEQVEKVTVAGLAGGRRHEEIARDIEERFGVAESSARLVARDQTLTLMAEVNAARQQNLGVERFVWRTVQDERVRSSHAELDGEEFAWDDLPENGDGEEIQPGSEILCRCWAEAILPDLI